MVKKYAWIGHLTNAQGGMGTAGQNNVFTALQVNASNSPVPVLGRGQPQAGMDHGGLLG